MRTKERPLGPPALILGTLCTASMCAGCASNRKWGLCTNIGAVVGALGGAASGIAIANYARGSHHTQSREAPTIGAAFAGAAAGAPIGAMAGHYRCDPEEETTTTTSYETSRTSQAPMTPPSGGMSASSGM